MTPTGVVLTGGRSRRMGTDKAMIEIGGEVLAVRVAGALAGGGCDPVVCQGGDAEALARHGLRVVPDSEPGLGPLHAIADALARAAPAYVVVSACDLPGLDAATVARLVAAGDAHPDVNVIAAADASGPHLLAVWRQPAAEDLAELLEQGVRSYRAALERLRALIVQVPPSAVVNVNRPQDLP
jgi:molybdopterin-guanine dinucleotide biosynthesis protein A